MKTGYLFATALLACGISSSAFAQAEFVKSIDLSTQLAPTQGVIPVHISIDQTGATPILYVTTINDTATTKTSIPALKIEDPLGATPTITVVDSNTGLNNLGVAATRGYGGTGTDGQGNVYFCWTGNGNDDSARIRRYNQAGSMTGEWLWTHFQQRFGGIDVSKSSPSKFIGARFLNTSTQTTSFGTFGATLSSLGIVTPTHTATATAGNPRDISYNDVNDVVYVNVNGILKAVSPTTGNDINTPSAYTTAQELATMAVNSFAGHGVGVSPNGQLIGFSPSQNTGVGANTLRIVNPTGTLVETLGTLNTKGDGTGANLGRPVDIVFANIGGTNYAFVTDYDTAAVASRTFSRVAVYSLTQAVPVSLSGFELE